MGPILGGKTHHNIIKIAFQRHPLSDPVSGLILASVGIPFLELYTFKIIKIHRGLCLQIENELLGVDIEIKQNLDAIWASFWHQKSTNIEEYSPPKGYQKWVRFLYRFVLNFGSILGALLEPCSPPRGPQDGPRAAQDAFRRRLGGVLEPGAAQEAPKRRPDPLQDWILDPSRPRF